MSVSMFVGLHTTGKKQWGGTVFKRAQSSPGQKSFTMHLKGPFSANCYVGIVPEATQKGTLGSNPIGQGVFILLNPTGTIHINGNAIVHLSSTVMWSVQHEVIMKFDGTRFEINGDGLGWIDVNAQCAAYASRYGWTTGSFDCPAIAISGSSQIIVTKLDGGVQTGNEDAQGGQIFHPVAKFLMSNHLEVRELIFRELHFAMRATIGHTYVHACMHAYMHIHTCMHACRCVSRRR